MLLGALAATLPLIVLLIGIPLMMKPAAKVAPIAWAVTVLTAILVFHFPTKLVLLAALQGGLTGIFPIMYIPFGALVIYNVMKVTGWMDKMQQAMANLTIDRRAQALLIAFGFGAFLEGICGFGAPVAIPAMILVGLGYNPMMAAIVCLVANTGPVPFGSLAIPTVTLAKTTGLDLMKLSQMTGRLMAPLAFVMAFATVYAMSKGRGMRGSIGTILVTGLSFSVTQYLVSNYIGPDLTTVLAALVCLAATATYLKFQKKTEPWLFEGENAAAAAPREFHPKELLLSWLPYLLLAVFVICVNLPKTRGIFSGNAPGWSALLIKFQIYNPGKIYAFSWLQTPGTVMLIAGLVAFPFLGVKYSVVGTQFGKTFKQMIPSFIAVACILSISEVMNLGLPILDPKTKLAAWGMVGVKQISMVATLSNGIVSLVSQHVYPLLAPLFGMIGVFLTGSNTSANALFGNLQKLTAQGMGLSEILMASAGSAGSTAGKMISPQSIVIAAAAVGLAGKEGLIMRQTIKYTIPYIILLALMTWGFAFMFPGLVP
ncbi:MAG TPA: L-lactate permease [Geothrix sp.]